MSKNLLELLVIDDEDLSRELIKNCINWSDKGFDIVYEASSANEAIKYIKEHVPDVVITDICMPEMDGIEFSRIILEKYPHVKVIVLTGHNDFAYAKESLKIGVFDFLLKPIDYEEMESVANKVKISIEQENLQKKQYIDLKNKLKESLPYLKEKFFNELIQFNMNFDNIKNKLEYFNIDIKDDIFRVAVFEIQEIDNFRNNEEKVLINRLQALEILKRYFENYKYINIFFDNSQNIVLLCNDFDIDLNDICEIVRKNILNSIKCVLNVGIGSIYNSINSVYESYKEAVESINYKVLVGKNQII